MSLYYDAASVLDANNQNGSLKSRVYAKDSKLRSKPAHLYALISETAKYDTFLTEVINNAGILKLEPKLTPLLSLLLIHDQFFAKGGIAAATNHPLRQAIDRHKARLQSEFTKARLRHRLGNVEQLKARLLDSKGCEEHFQPRWARINVLKRKFEDLSNDFLADYTVVKSLDQLKSTTGGPKVYYVDSNVPNLLAFASDTELTKSEAYAKGEIILQEKASCFPAHLLVGGEHSSEVEDVIDSCAAPGNKTTHLAAILAGNGIHGRIFACERDSARSKTLQDMVTRAGADKSIDVLQKQDFLALDPYDIRFANVSHLLLDPSCSGSGITRREDIPVLTLPDNPRAGRSPVTGNSRSNSKKRKHDSLQKMSADTMEPTETDTTAEARPMHIDQVRLQKLSNLQSLIVEHAFSFPHAQRVTYSTCSIHVEENEAVVERVLKSEIAQKRGWKVLRRDDQVSGLREWKHRGVSIEENMEGKTGHNLTVEQREACIRCTPGDGEGTMGFFVCGFVRDSVGNDFTNSTTKPSLSEGPLGDENDEWEGFSDT